MTREQAVSAWLDVMESCHLFLVAGLERTSTSPAETRAALRDWYRQHMQEHDRMLIRLARNFHERSATNAPPSDP
jgi:hypothetical protein